MVDVNFLRDMGMKVKVTHYRRYYSLQEAPKGPPKVVTVLNPNYSSDVSKALPKGGKTVIEVTDAENNTFVAEAVCSDSDQFNKSVGSGLLLVEFTEKCPTKFSDMKAFVCISNDHSAKDIRSFLDRIKCFDYQYKNTMWYIKTEKTEAEIKSMDNPFTDIMEISTL